MMSARAPSAIWSRENVLLREEHRVLTQDKIEEVIRKVSGGDFGPQQQMLEVLATTKNSDDKLHDPAPV
jgi:hypothetical protein